MGAYIINVPSTVDRIIYVHVDANGKTAVVSQQMEDLTPYTEPDLEREQEEIKVGDEVIAASGKAVIIDISDNKDKARYIYSDSTLGFDNICNLTKTGRHFPEIATVLKKMRGEQDG